MIFFKLLYLHYLRGVTSEDLCKAHFRTLQVVKKLITQRHCGLVQFQWETNNLNQYQSGTVDTYCSALNFIHAAKVLFSILKMNAAIVSLIKIRELELEDGFVIPSPPIAGGARCCSVAARRLSFSSLH